MAYDDIQDQIDAGRQQAADELGPPYDVYRPVSADGAGSVLIPANKISSFYNVFVKIAYGGQMRQSLEADKQAGIIWYEITADMSPFRVGDIFVLNDPVYGAGYSSVNFSNKEFKGFSLSDHSPIKKALGGRLNCCVEIHRPGVAADSNKRFGRTNQDSVPLVLSGGTYSLGAAGAVPVKVPAGLVSQGRSYGDKGFDATPADKRKSGWELYLPALKGFDAKEGDRVIGPDGSRYLVIIPYTQKVGASGSQWFLEREAAG